ncbi:von Willebrand factor type A domain protein [Paraburkholderia xenovorans LB400]|uniref:Carbon monoxide dehydrogenase, CoxE subunit n=1 Tax=Paraburkholderia xenovorans (strain LB400) TaxID=266265 RepID=Q13IX8_PARXL|nr:VWA domain-containing protein [Paraburkholderia xenovorans]ABE35961.1 Putative carbon monoxide dehydrogenase, CoxE subunit [Paraburkholderia xenovorans LB400]AIP34750.1 von Willebrand factor type A domain protein [Paraburkholderia xenovorans LB400]
MLTGIDGAAAPRPQPSGLEEALTARYAGFAGWLRANDFQVTGSDVAASMEVALRMGQLDSQVLRWSLRALLCSRAQEWRRFDELFDAYFFAPNRRKQVETRAGGAGRIEPDPAAGQRDGSEGAPLSPASGGGAAPPDGSTAEQGACGEASLAQADFRHLNQPDELFAIDTAIRRFAQRLQGIQLRSERRANAGSVIDMAWTVRRSVSRGGLPLELGWRRKRRLRPRIVLLLDVSRSMSLYSFFYLRLARVLSARVSDVHCFIFHTRLVAIEQALRDPDPWRSQERLQLLSAGWAGGTRIGDSLDEFNRQQATRLLHSRTAVVVVSDGYDAGEPERLQQALATMRRRCRCVVWLNPLASRADFAPASAGMQAALPYIDLLAGARDLASLERVLPQVLSVLQ